VSKLILKGHGGARFDLNITQFRSPMSASIASVQTRTRQHHFPIRAGQPDIQFTAHFTTLDEKHRFTNFVRDHQQNTQKSRFTPGSTPYQRGLVTLMWPERNIVDWTGYITNLPVREPRFEYAPKVTFGVMLVDSLMSVSTTSASQGNSWWFIRGLQIPQWQPWMAESDFLEPNRPASQDSEVDTGQVVSSVLQNVTTAGSTITNLITGLFR
jgi:hypothetical protein